MKHKKYQMILAVLLILFFAVAAVMTVLSQKEYEKNCIEVVTDKQGTRESIVITKSCFVECMPDENGDLEVDWDMGELNGMIEPGNNVTIATDEQVLTGVFKEVLYDYEMIPKYIIATNWCLADTSDQSFGVTVTAKINGPFRSYVYPISCLVNDSASLKVKVVISRQKVWGTEYYVHYENIRVHEMNDEKFSIILLPVDGEIIVESEGRLYEGAKVKVIEQR